MNPTSKQLQELRDAFAEAEGINVFPPEDGGAWATERELGIVPRGVAPYPIGLMDESRGRAYPGLSDAEADTLEKLYGIPFAWRMTLDQWPELPQPTWGGFTAEALEAVSDA